MKGIIGKLKIFDYGYENEFYFYFTVLSSYLLALL